MIPVNTGRRGHLEEAVEVKTRKGPVKGVHEMKVFGRLLLMFSVPVLALSCSWSSKEEESMPSASGVGALDTILMCEDSGEEGPVNFPHRLHYASRAHGGRSIGCKTCHHDFEDRNGPPPDSCRTCHVSHDRGESAVAGFL